LVVTALCSSFSTDPHAVRARWLGWLANGAREVAWALCSIPAERWLAAPPRSNGGLGQWPPARHVRHLALNESRLIRPVVDAVLDRQPERVPSRSELDQVDAAWDASLSSEAVEGLVATLGESRFSLLQRLEAAPDEVWQRPLPAGVAPGEAPAHLDWLLAHARQHELEHLAALWTLALYWDRISPSTASGVSLPLQPADRLEESH
jgi:DinB superfamily